MKRPVLAVVVVLALAAAGCIPPQGSPVGEVLGSAYAEGFETEAEWMNYVIPRLRSLAEGGDRLAQADLGKIYYARQDHAKAAKWIRIAAQRGDPGSQMAHLGCPTPTQARPWAYRLVL